VLKDRYANISKAGTNRIRYLNWILQFDYSFYKFNNNIYEYRF